MEVFSVFATLSLVDMISGPLGRITRSMNVANAATAGLGERMGNLALVQRTQNLLGADYSSVNIGETFMHKLFLPFIVLCAYHPRGRLAQQT